MSLSGASEFASRDKLKFLTRAFGWAVLAHFTVWMVSNVLTQSFDWPGVAAIWNGGASFLSFIQLIAYVVVVSWAIHWVWRTEETGLRDDAAKIADFNIMLVRWAFYAVLFIGLADMVISFLRVEGLLEYIVGKEMTTALGRSAFRGPWVHIPLMVLAVYFGVRSKSLGFHWLALLIVVAELAIVITRFIFSYEQAFMGDLVRFWYAALFLFASAYTLHEEGHVRVDVFYAGMKGTTKGFINAVCSIAFGIVLCWTILIVCLDGKGSPVYGSIANFEVSQSGYGMYVKYLLAAFLVVFAVTMLIQFVSYLMESVADYRDEPGSRLDREVVAH
ncbi:MAG: TRAP transporter small permease subunit [Rhizobiaceae bacterium]